jgi:hypothetical protein
MAIMTTTSLSQPSKRGTHLFSGLQRLHSQCIDLSPLLADLDKLIDFAGRNHDYAIQICHNEVSRVNREWLRLLW